MAELEIDGCPSLLGTCRFCDETDVLIYEDTELCEPCESDSIYCSVCDERHPSDGACRHLLWLNHGEWGGVGSNETNAKKYLAEAMFRVSGAIGWKNSRLLSKAIRDHQYHFFYTDSMLGGSMRLDLRFGSLSPDEAEALRSALQGVVNWLQYDGEDEELTESLQWLWTLWAGGRTGDLCGLKTTPEWDIAAAAAIDDAFAVYVPIA